MVGKEYFFIYHYHTDHTLSKFMKYTMKYVLHEIIFITHKLHFGRIFLEYDFQNKFPIV